MDYPHLALVGPDTLVVGSHLQRPGGAWFARIVGLDVASGRERWRWESPPGPKSGYAVADIKALPDGAVVVSMSCVNAIQAPLPEVLCLDGATGHVRWRWNHPPDWRDPNLSSEVRLADAGGVIVANPAGLNPEERFGVLHYLDSTTGATRWWKVWGGDAYGRQLLGPVARVPGGDLVVLSSSPFNVPNRFTALRRLSPMAAKIVWESRVPDNTNGGWFEWQCVATPTGELFAARVGGVNEGGMFLETARWSLTDGHQLWRRRIPLESHRDVSLCLPFAGADGVLRVVTNQAATHEHFSFAEMRQNLRRPRLWFETETVGSAWLHTFRTSDGTPLSSARLGDVHDAEDGFVTGRWLDDGGLWFAGVRGPMDGKPAATTWRWPASEFAPGHRPRVQRRQLARPFTHGWCNFLPLPDGRIAGSGQDGASGEAVWWVAAW